MNAEQQMKQALDGKFFYLTPEGRTECREVPEGFNGHYMTHQYQKDAARAGGLKRARVTKPEHDWTDNEMMMLMHLRRKKASMVQIAIHLGLSRWLCKKKCGEMGI